KILFATKNLNPARLSTICFLGLPSRGTKHSPPLSLPPSIHPAIQHTTSQADTRGHIHPFESRREHDLSCYQFTRFGPDTDSPLCQSSRGIKPSPLPHTVFSVCPPSWGIKHLPPLSLHPRSSPPSSTRRPHPSHVSASSKGTTTRPTTSRAHTT